VADALGICLFICSSLMAVTMADLALAFSQATGWETDEETLWRAGRRIITLERAYNLRHGLSRADDQLPARFLEEPLPGGKSAGRIAHHLDQMVDEYYAHRGWTAQGVPTPETLRQLELGDLVPDLWPAGA